MNRIGQIPSISIDSKRVSERISYAMEEDDLPRAKGDAASKLTTEDLAPYSQDELAERIALLKAEIARVQAHSDKAAKHRAAADALFKGSGS